jgi:nicotinamide mononucleotide transporter
MSKVLDFLQQAFGSTWPEWTGIALTLSFIFLLARQNPVGWPLGILACIAYAWIFGDVKLYADMTLQIVFACQLAYGWWLWTRKRDGGSAGLAVTRMSLRGWTVFVAIWLPVSALYGLVLSRYTGASLPWIDATLATASVLTQYLQARKILENWLLWIGINAAYAVVYFYKGLHPTILLMAILIALALRGYLAWRRTLRPARR